MWALSETVFHEKSAFGGIKWLIPNDVAVFCDQHACTQISALVEWQHIYQYPPQLWCCSLCHPWQPWTDFVLWILLFHQMDSLPLSAHISKKKTCLVLLKKRHLFGAKNRLLKLCINLVTTHIRNLTTAFVQCRCCVLYPSFWEAHLRECYHFLTGVQKWTNTRVRNKKGADLNVLCYVNQGDSSSHLGAVVCPSVFCVYKRLQITHLPDNLDAVVLC